MGTINKTLDEINQSISFADDLRKLKTPSEISEGVDRAGKSKRKPYPSVAAMIADDSIEVGEVVETVSYYDGWAAENGSPIGGNSYLKVSGQSPDEDGGSIIYTSDGNHFKAIFNSIISPAHFGELSDYDKEGETGTDNYTAWHNAIQYISNMPSGGTLYIENGKRAVDSPLYVPRGVRIEFESPSARVFYRGNGFFLNFIATDHTDISTYYKFVSVLNGRIEDASGGLADGAIYTNGAYLVDMAGEIFGFSKGGAKGCRINNTFNFTYEKGLINSIANGWGISIEGDADGIQVTNIKIGDNLLIQRCNIDIEIATVKQAQAVEISNMALQLADDASGIVISGNVANIKVGPAIHAECYADSNDANSSEFFRITDTAKIRTLIVDGVDLYNIKEYFNIDASNGAIATNVNIGNLYSSSGNVTTGKAFVLKGITGDVVIGEHNIDGSKYDLFDIVGCNPIFNFSAIDSTKLPTNAGYKGLISVLKDKDILNDRDFLRIFDGNQWYRFLMASASGVIRATGDIQWSDQRRIALVQNSPEGSLTAQNGSIAIEDNGRIWKKNSGGFTNMGWVELVGFYSATTSQLSDVSDNINTIGKHEGKMVFNSTAGYYVYASANNSTASWNKLSDNTADITPS